MTEVLTVYRCPNHHRTLTPRWVTREQPYCRSCPERVVPVRVVPLTALEDESTVEAFGWRLAQEDGEDTRADWDVNAGQCRDYQTERARDLLADLVAFLSGPEETR